MNKGHISEQRVSNRSCALLLDESIGADLLQSDGREIPCACVVVRPEEVYDLILCFGDVEVAWAGVEGLFVQEVEAGVEVERREVERLKVRVAFFVESQR